jgi:hypothetical protein
VITAAQFNAGLAMTEALSMPAWLEDWERFSISGGLGFGPDGSPALGMTGIMRIRGSLSGFAGLAVAPERGGFWGGRVGARFGW